MKQETMSDHDVVSALADGQLRGDDFVRAVNLLEASEEHRSTWNTYHAIGDLMRTGEYQTSYTGSDFLQRLRLNLAKEPLPTHESSFVLSGLPEKLVDTSGTEEIAANNSFVRWKAWGGIFSVIVVSALIWQIFTGVEDPPRMAQLTSAETPVFLPNSVDKLSLVGNQEVMIHDPRLDALLAAHQQLGGTSAFQNPTGFVRSAMFTGVGR